MMKVFVSWSGSSTKGAAEALKTFLRDVVQHLDPWVSSDGIGAGVEWHRALTRRLEESPCAVICVARSNLGAPWLNFEAGAVSKGNPDATVCPYLLDVQPSEIRDSPLAAFQACSADENGTFKLVSALNGRLGEHALDPAALRRAFDRAWPDFEKALVRFRSSTARSNEIFVSAPMASLSHADYDTIREEVIVFIEKLRAKFGTESVYSAMLRINEGRKVEPEKLAFQRDMKALQQATRLAMFYPVKAPSSCIFEAGHAFAMRKPAVYFVKHGVSLPFVLEGAAHNEPNLVTKLEYRDREHLLDIIDENADLLFPAQPAGIP